MPIFARPTRPGHRGRAFLIALGLTLTVDLLWVFGRFPRLHRDRIMDEGALPATGSPVLVLGAGVYGSGEPTQVLEGRLQTALRLHQAGKVSWFLVSGDNREASYNEPLAMRRWLVKHGVPPTQIVSDFAGRRTYDSLRRAQVVFGQSSLVIVTSDFHMPRALYLAESLGIRAYGVPASTDRHRAGQRVSFWIRETIARHLAVLDAWFPPSTVLGPREPTPDDLVPEAPAQEKRP